MRNRCKLNILVAIMAFLSACSNYSEKDGTLVCGVPVKGTAWELAASVADNGDGSFIPESVEQYADKAYIKGWIDTNSWEKPYRELPYDDGYVPAEVICDVENGSVTHALLYCEILDQE